MGKSENYLEDKTDRIWHLSKRGGKLVKRKREPPSTLKYRKWYSNTRWQVRHRFLYNFECVMFLNTLLFDVIEIYLNVLRLNLFLFERINTLITCEGYRDPSLKLKP